MDITPFSMPGSPPPRPRPAPPRSIAVHKRFWRPQECLSLISAADMDAKEAALLVRYPGASAGMLRASWLAVQQGLALASESQTEAATGQGVVEQRSCLPTRVAACLLPPLRSHALLSEP